MVLCLPTHVHFNIKCQVSMSTFIVKDFVIHTINNWFIGKHFKSLTTCLSQVSGMEHGGGPRKRASTFRFTEYQLCELTKRFKVDPYIKQTEKQLMARNLGIKLSSITNWFKEQRRPEQNLANEVSNATIVTG